MPELPEVETVRRGLLPFVEGARFARVETRRADLRFPFPERFSARLEGARVETLARRAKYLVAHLSTGEALVLHLGMTGRFIITPKGAAEGRSLGDYVYDTGPPEKHAHAVFRMSNGATITYSDPRRFGYMLLIPEPELGAHTMFQSLGVEPLGDALSAEYLARRAQGRKADLKAFLMDQRIVAGLGNIYVCEALFRAGLKPTRRSGTLATRGGAPTPHCLRLVPAIQSVLHEALSAGGSTLRDYRQADGSEGGFQKTFGVYGREGEPCATAGCQGIVHRSTQAGRSSFYCPVCQR